MDLRGVGCHMGKSSETSLEVLGSTSAAMLFGLTSPTG